VAAVTKHAYMVSVNLMLALTQIIPILDSQRIGITQPDGVALKLMRHRRIYIYSNGLSFGP